MLSLLPIPDKNTFYLLAGLAVVGLIASFWPALIPLWEILAWLSAVILFLDLILSAIINNPMQLLEVERNVSGSIPLGVSRHIDLRIHNHSNRSQVMDVFDHYPNQVQSEGLPISVSIQGQQHAQYSIQDCC